jgi:hypothetical protein
VIFIVPMQILPQRVTVTVRPWKGSNLTQALAHEPNEMCASVAIGRF